MASNLAAEMAEMINAKNQRIATLEADNATLHRHLQAQIDALIQCRDTFTKDTLVHLAGRIPEGIDPHGHPIEQVVGTVLSVMDGRIATLEAALRDVIAGNWSPTGIQDILGDLNEKPRKATG